MNPLRDHCPCGCATWRVTASPEAPIVRCDGCGRLAEPTEILQDTRPEGRITVLIDDDIANETWWVAAAKHLGTAPAWAEDFLCARQEVLELSEDEVAELLWWISTFYDLGVDAPMPIIFRDKGFEKHEAVREVFDEYFRAFKSGFVSSKGES